MTNNASALFEIYLDNGLKSIFYTCEWLVFLFYSVLEKSL